MSRSAHGAMPVSFDRRKVGAHGQRRGHRGFGLGLGARQAPDVLLVVIDREAQQPGDIEPPVGHMDAGPGPRRVVEHPQEIDRARPQSAEQPEDVIQRSRPRSREAGRAPSRTSAARRRRPAWRGATTRPRLRLPSGGARPGRASIPRRAPVVLPRRGPRRPAGPGRTRSARRARRGPPAARPEPPSGRGNRELVEVPQPPALGDVDGVERVQVHVDDAVGRIGDDRGQALQQPVRPVEPA